MQSVTVSGSLGETFKNYLLRNLYDGISIGTLNFTPKLLLFGENDKIKIAKRKNLQYIY
jgi:hypothetical protein